MSVDEIKVTAHQREDVQNAVILTGVPRSGTTITGKLLSTYEGIDYHFEPPTFYMISSLYAAGHLEENAAQSLLSVFLYEDLLLESVHGRKLNLRPQDDSQVLNSISWKSVVERWSTVSDRSVAQQWVKQGKLRLAVKMPNVMDSVDLLNSTLPRSQFVLTVRDGRQVVRSIVTKGWLNEVSLNNELYPYHHSNTRVNAPYWVEKDQLASWDEWSEWTRACYMWRRHAEFALTMSSSEALTGSRLMIVRYEELLKAPEDVSTHLAEFLGHNATQYTRQRVSEIHLPDSIKQVNLSDFYHRVDEQQLELFRQCNRQWGYDD